MNTVSKGLIKVLLLSAILISVHKINYCQYFPDTTDHHRGKNGLEYMEASTLADIPGKNSSENDQLTLQPRTWNWISFPRLVREGNGTVSSVDQLENIAPFPTTGQMTHWVPINQGTQSILWNEHVYTGNLINIQSTLGYKLETSNHDVAILRMSGTVRAPETTEPLSATGLTY